MSEGNAASGPRQPIGCAWLWILDPLDGTKVFLAGPRVRPFTHLALITSSVPSIGWCCFPDLIPALVSGWSLA